MKNGMRPIHPGEILLEEFLKPLNMNASKLADAMGVAPKTVSAIVAGEREITPDMALRLSRALGPTPKFWLNLQQSHDAARRRWTVRLCRAYVAYDMARGDAGKSTDIRLERTVADVAGGCIGCVAMQRLPEDANARPARRRVGEAKALAIVRELLSELAGRKPTTRRASGRAPTTGTRNR